LAVTEGRTIAGPLVRMACERHLRDLKEGPDRGLTWDIPAAQRVFEYFSEVLTHPDGSAFTLHPSQQFIIGSLFGWKIADGTRRFRQAYIEQGKGSGKSPMAAGVGMYMLTADGEDSAVVFSAAVDKDQAKIPFLCAVGYVTRSELLSGAITKSGGKMGDQTRVHNLFHRKSGSYFRPLTSESTGKGKSGFLISCAIIDELHEHPTSAMVEFVRANTKGRRQPLILMITNSGVYDTTSVAWQYHSYAEEVLDGRREDDEFFFYVCGLSKGDDYRDKKNWPKANPLIDVEIPPVRYLEQQVREAAGMPSKESFVRRVNFCEWVESSNPWITKAVWDANAGAVDMDALEGRPCYGAMDLSRVNDLTALVLLFPNEDETKDVLVFAWRPEGNMREAEHQDRAPYSQWVREGFLRTTPGKTIDYAFIAQTLGELTQRYDFRAMAFDHWRFDVMERELNAIGVDLNCVDHPQGPVGMNPAIEAAEQDIFNARLRHGANPLLTWCVMNARVEKNAAGLQAFDKQKATKRIDPAVALAMACNLAASKVEYATEVRVRSLNYMPFPEIQRWMKSAKERFAHRDNGELLSLKGLSGYFPNPADWYLRNGFTEIASAIGGPVWAGQSVTLDTALAHSVVWACYRLISESMGYLPASVKRSSGGQKLDAVDHPMFLAMHNAPNEEMTAQTFKEMLTGHCMLGGDGYARIIRRSGTEVAMGLMPLLPEKVRLGRDNKKRLVYEILNERGIPDETLTVKPGIPHDILHLRGLSRDGKNGYNVLGMAGQSIGAGIAAERHAGSFWANGGRPPYRLHKKTKFKTDEDFDKFRGDWKATYADPSNVPITEGDIEYESIGTNMVDAQALETRQWTVSELARWWGVSPHLVNDLSRATFSNIEQLFLEFKTICLSRWVHRWEQEFWRCVLTPDEKSQGYFLKININALLRADFATRMSGYASALQNGHMNIDEVRDLEDRNPLPNGAGEAYHIQLNMAPVGSKPAEEQQPAPDSGKNWLHRIQ
jgi:HK97 family phage portal protein